MPQHRHKFALPDGEAHVLQHQRQSGFLLIAEGDMLGFYQLFQIAFLAFFVVFGCGGSPLPALPLFQSLLCHTAVEPQGRGQPVAVTGSPISEEKVVPFPAKRRLTVVFRIYSITLGLKPVV